VPPSSFTYPSDSLLAFEIAQQPKLWPTTLERVAALGFRQKSDGMPILVCGAGTSAYAASAITEAWPEAMAIPTTDLLLRSRTELLSALPGLTEGGLVISLARSGDSPESVAVVAKMQRLFPPVKHLAIVCNREGRLANTDGVRVLLLDERTNDRSLAMTASFSNLALAGLSLRHREQLARGLPAVCARVEGTLPELHQRFAEIARHCDDRIVILASCMQALTKETALKIIELTDGRIMAMPETFLGFRHGAVGFLREDTPVVCFIKNDTGKPP
jgi:tagatose-6-phosphate ketose/aldose isomerase